jgi:hypothetical protein
MKNLSDFIGPVKTRAMSVRVIANDGSVVKEFDAPEGFQLERYVDSLYPENEFMTYATNAEVNISVLENHGIVEVYIGTYK